MTALEHHPLASAAAECADAVLRDEPVWERVHVVEPGWWRVHALPDGRAVDVVMMIHNARLVVTDASGTGYDRGWCYAASHPVLAVVSALGAAMAWDGSDDTEPAGWVKDVVTGRYRPDGDPARERQRDDG